eukprot:403668_1
MSHSCASCQTTGAVLRCSSCKRVYYCNKKCQRIDWKSKHKKQCTQKYLQSSINNSKKERDQVFKNMGITDDIASQNCLPVRLFNKSKFVKFCVSNSKNMNPQIASAIYSYLTGYKTTFIIDNKEVELYLQEMFEQMFRCRVENMETFSFHDIMKLKSRNPNKNKKHYETSDWIKLREYNISILRDSEDDTAGDAVDINIQICPPDGASMSHCIAEFRANDIIEHFNGNAYGQLVKCVLDYYNLPYTKFKAIQLSHSVTNDNQIRKDLLMMLQTNIYDKIRPSFDYWSGEIGMEYENKMEYDAAKQTEDCSIM